MKRKGFLKSLGAMMAAVTLVPYVVRTTKLEDVKTHDHILPNEEIGESLTYVTHRLYCRGNGVTFARGIDEDFLGWVTEFVDGTRLIWVPTSSGELVWWALDRTEAQAAIDWRQSNQELFKYRDCVARQMFEQV